MPKRTHVVGHDGSSNGRNVVDGATRRLVPGDQLIIVHALKRQAPSPELETEQAEVRRRISNELDLSRLTGVDYELRFADGPPARALIEIALEEKAADIVVGTRRGPVRVGQRTIRSELEAGPVPVTALYRTAERESHPQAEPMDPIDRLGLDSFPASDPPASWSGPDDSAAWRPRSAA